MDYGGVLSETWGKKYVDNKHECIHWAYHRPWCWQRVKWCYTSVLPSSACWSCFGLWWQPEEQTSHSPPQCKTLFSSYWGTKWISNDEEEKEKNQNHLPCFSMACTRHNSHWIKNTVYIFVTITTHLSTLSHLFEPVSASTRLDCLHQAAVQRRLFLHRSADHGFELFNWPKHCHWLWCTVTVWRCIRCWMSGCLCHVPCVLQTRCEVLSTQYLQEKILTRIYFSWVKTCNFYNPGFTYTCLALGYGLWGCGWFGRWVWRTALSRVWASGPSLFNIVSVIAGSHIYLGRAIRLNVVILGCLCLQRVRTSFGGSNTVRSCFPRISLTIWRRFWVVH